MISIVAKLREFAPYAAILMLPGGSVMAVLLWLYRRQKRASLLPEADILYRVRAAFRR
jgi:hypothetical protein